MHEVPDCDRLLLRSIVVAGVTAGEMVEAMFQWADLAAQLLQVQARSRLKATLVELLRGKSADVRVQTPSVFQEKAAIFWDSEVLPEQMLEGRHCRAVGVRGLQGLLQLLRIADEYQAACGRSDRERRGERHLPGLVDDENVHRAFHVFTRPQPCGARSDLKCAGVQTGAHTTVICGLVDFSRAALGLLVDFLKCAKRDAFFPGGVHHLGHEVLDDLVTKRGDADLLARSDQL